MRTLHDGQIYALQEAGGVNRYFAELFARMPADFRPTVVTLGTCGTTPPSHPRLRVLRAEPRRLDHVSYRLSGLAARAESRLRREGRARYGYDLAHPTYYTLLSGRVRDYRMPVVLTVYDFIHERFAAQLDPEGVHAAAKREALLAADLLLCISESTRRDLLDLYPALEARARVIPLASGLDESAGCGPEPVPERPYFLYVGSRAPYKNFGTLLEAFARVRGRDAALCVAGPGFTESESRRMAELNLNGSVIHYGYASDAHLAKLYRHSVALVYPSLYEGFGIPPLEAMACGAPVVALNSSSLPEVVGGAGVLVDRPTADVFADAMRMLLDYPSERGRLAEKGRERAARFSWERTAALTFDAYREVAGR